MANQWLRLWHDMPNDPKWRTIARVSGEPISLVVAIYIHLLVTASQNVTRGHIPVTNEDLASALDVTEEQIERVVEAMQGRVLEGDYLTGWESRQPKREDAGNPNSTAKSAAERKREQRERERARENKGGVSRDVTQCHEASRNVTLDKEKDTDKDNITPHTPQGADALAEKKKAAKEAEKKLDEDFAKLWATWEPFEMDKGGKQKARKSFGKINFKKLSLESLLAAADSYCEKCRRLEKKTQHVVTWLNQEGWKDEEGQAVAKSKASLENIPTDLAKRLRNTGMNNSDILNWFGNARFENGGKSIIVPTVFIRDRIVQDFGLHLESAIGQGVSVQVGV